MKIFGGGERGGELFGTEKKIAATQRKELGLRGSQLRGFRGVDLGSCLTVEEGREGSESTDVQGVWARWLIRQQFPPEVKGCRWNPSRKGKDPSPEIKELGFVLAAHSRGYTVVTEPPRVVGFKQGSGKVLCAFQITLAPGLVDLLEDLLEARLKAGTPVRKRPLQQSN